MSLVTLVEKEGENVTVDVRLARQLNSFRIMGGIYYKMN